LEQRNVTIRLETAAVSLGSLESHAISACEECLALNRDKAAVHVTVPMGAATLTVTL